MCVFRAWDFMPQNYVPIFICHRYRRLAASDHAAVGQAGATVESQQQTKLMPYECGIDPIDSARGRYTVRYYIIAILFVVFDVETIFLFPWAVKFKAFGFSCSVCSRS